jgi:Lamin Tail Domain
MPNWKWTQGLLLSLVLLLGCPTDDDDSADDDAGDDDASDDDAGDDDSVDAMPCNVLCVNEFMASNAATYPDESAAFPDWIELYNPGGADLDLAGYTITDDLGMPTKHLLAAGLIVPAGEWLLLFADRDIKDGDNHLAFALSRDGEEIGLYDPDGGVLDEIDYGPQETDISRAREGDGGSPWRSEINPTPWDSNE